jgi:hypothetical protein
VNTPIRIGPVPTMPRRRHPGAGLLAGGVNSRGAFYLTVAIGARVNCKKISLLTELTVRVLWSLENLYSTCAKWGFV